MHWRPSSHIREGKGHRRSVQRRVIEIDATVRRLLQPPAAQPLACRAGETAGVPAELVEARCVAKDVAPGEGGAAGAAARVARVAAGVARAARAAPAAGREVAEGGGRGDRRVLGPEAAVAAAAAHEVVQQTEEAAAAQAEEEETTKRQADNEGDILV